MYDKIIFEQITDNLDDAKELKERCQILIAKFMSFYSPVAGEQENQIQQLAAYDYLIVWPYTDEQIEQLTYVFGPENVVIMFRTAILAVLTRFQK